MEVYRAIIRKCIREFHALLAASLLLMVVLLRWGFLLVDVSRALVLLPYGDCQTPYGESHSSPAGAIRRSSSDLQSCS
jgi:hypothetical protein